MIRKFSLLFAIFFLNFLHLTADSLMDEKIELENYVNNFPYNEYQIYEVPLQGRFYVEPNLQDTIKNFLRKGETWEPHIITLIDKYAKSGSVVLDIGAHIGTFSNFMAKKVGSEGRVHAFEPQKKLYRELIHNSILNGNENIIAPHRCAIGDCHKLIQMDVMTYPGSEGSTSIGSGGDIAEMFTLDSFNFKNVSLIKIDVERTEEQVVDGMMKTIKSNYPVIIIELQGGYLWETAPLEIKEKMKSTQNKLIKMGYFIQRIYMHDYLAIPITKIFKK